MSTPVFCDFRVEHKLTQKELVFLKELMEYLSTYLRNTYV